HVAGAVLTPIYGTGIDLVGVARPAIVDTNVVGSELGRILAKMIQHVDAGDLGRHNSSRIEIDAMDDALQQRRLAIRASDDDRVLERHLPVLDQGKLHAGDIHTKIALAHSRREQTESLQVEKNRREAILCGYVQSCESLRTQLAIGIEAV